MTEPRRLELAWLFGLYARVIPPPGEDGDEMSFAYDGATFTPGEFVADSGSRTVDVELTLGGNAITSGTMMFVFARGSDAALADLNVTTEPYVNSIDGAEAGNYESAGPMYVQLCYIQAADGHTKMTVEFGNDSAAAADVYVYVSLPTGAVAISDAISVPGVGE